MPKKPPMPDMPVKKSAPPVEGPANFLKESTKRPYTGSPTNFIGSPPPKAIGKIPPKAIGKGKKV